MSDLVKSSIDNMDMMTKIARDEQSLDDIKMLTSSKVTDQLKVFLIAQARNELSRVIKLTHFLDKLETNFMNEVDKEMNNNNLTLKQYSDIIGVITSLLTRSNEIISRVLKDDTLMTILNTTIYTADSTSQSTSIVANLKDAQSRERVRLMIQKVLTKTSEFSTDDNVITVEDGGENNG